MSEALFSPSWYRVATLQPRLRPHAQIHRHRYRGQRWYVLQDHASQRLHRFSPAAYSLLGLMNGQRTVQEIWELANIRLGDDAPTQDEVIQLLTQLHVADVLQCNVSPDTTELLLRSDRQRRRTWQSQLLNPLFWRLPLWDPERFLQWLLPLVRPVFGPLGVLLWCLVVGLGMGLTALYWHDLTADVVDHILATHNLVLLWLVFPVLKTLHEFGHAFAVKSYGGEVHEMGVMLLVFMPLPYVDASAATAFASTWQRLVVDAAGMMVELFLASLALMVWLNVEPGLVRTVAYNTMFIAGISTVLFNGNPLLRYDGYYMLADLLQIPNLRGRAQAYMTYLAERYLFGSREAECETTTRAERTWFVGFAIASWAYRLFVLVVITLFIASRFFFIGVLFALGSVVGAGVVPIAKGLRYLSSNPRLRRVRRRAVVVSALIVAGLMGVIGWLPMPLRSRAEGVIWIPEHAVVRANTPGFVTQVMVQSGALVRQGEVLIVCTDPALTRRAAVLEARLRELQVRYAIRWREDLTEAEIIKEEIALVAENLARTRERLAGLTIRSRVDGTFVIPQAQSLLGQFVKQGTQLAYVLDLTTLTVRVLVSQADIDLVRHRTQGVEVRLAERRAVPIPALISREVPAASAQLPSMALGSRGGGEVVTEPTDTQGVKAMHTLFQFDLALPSSVGVVNVGGRAYVRFDHGWEPLAQRWYRQVRRLFLSKFHV
jgi:putative peptide zinc metalloprotease protein